jgi:hypothetical protein
MISALENERKNINAIYVYIADNISRFVHQNKRKRLANQLDILCLIVKAT